MTKIDVINAKFLEEYIKYMKYIDVSEYTSFKQFEVIANEIIKLEYTNICLELTPSNALIFKLKLDNEKILFITHIFVEDDINSDVEIVFSYFINREPIISDTGKLSPIIDGFNNYLKNNAKL